MKTTTFILFTVHVFLFIVIFDAPKQIKRCFFFSKFRKKGSTILKSVPYVLFFIHYLVLGSIILCKSNYAQYELFFFAHMINVKRPLVLYFWREPIRNSSKFTLLYYTIVLQNYLKTCNGCILYF